MTASLIQKLAAYECEVAQLKVENAKLAEQVEHYREVISAMVIQPESSQQELCDELSKDVKFLNPQPYNLKAMQLDLLIRDQRRKLEVSMAAWHMPVMPPKA